MAAIPASKMVSNVSSEYVDARERTNTTQPISYVPDVAHELSPCLQQVLLGVKFLAHGKIIQEKDNKARDQNRADQARRGSQRIVGLVGLIKFRSQINVQCMAG